MPQKDCPSRLPKRTKGPCIKLPDDKLHLMQLLMQCSQHVDATQVPELGNMNLFGVQFMFIVSVYDDDEMKHDHISVTFPFRVAGKDIINRSVALAELIADRRRKPAFYKYNDGDDPTGKKEYSTIFSALHNHGKSLTPVHCSTKSPDPSNPAHGQFINHSESSGFVFLHSSQMILGLFNRLYAVLRERKLCETDSLIEVHQMLMLGHSTRNPCGVCETTAVAMKNSNATYPGGVLGFMQRAVSVLDDSEHKMVISNPKKAFDIVMSAWNMMPKHRITKKLAHTHLKFRSAEYRLYICVLMLDREQSHDHTHNDSLSYSVFGSGSETSKSTPIAAKQHKKAQTADLAEVKSAMRAPRIATAPPPRRPSSLVRSLFGSGKARAGAGAGVGAGAGTGAGRSPDSPASPRPFRPSSPRTP